MSRAAADGVLHATTTSFTSMLVDQPARDLHGEGPHLVEVARARRGSGRCRPRRRGPRGGPGRSAPGPRSGPRTRCRTCRWDGRPCTREATAPAPAPRATVAVGGAGLTSSGSCGASASDGLPACAPPTGKTCSGRKDRTRSSPGPAPDHLDRLGAVALVAHVAEEPPGRPPQHRALDLHRVPAPQPVPLLAAVQVVGQLDRVLLGASAPSPVDRGALALRPWRLQRVPAG